MRASLPFEHYPGQWFISAPASSSVAAPYSQTTPSFAKAIRITMKFSISLIALLLSSLVASEGLSFSFGGQKPLGDGEAVPGNNPLTYCQAEHGDDILILDHVNLTPNPPQAYVYILVQHILLHQLTCYQWRDAHYRGRWNAARRGRQGCICYFTSQIWIDQTCQYPSRSLYTGVQR
jgi:hypothetical protein